MRTNDDTLHKGDCPNKEEDVKEDEGEKEHDNDE